MVLAVFLGWTVGLTLGFQDEGAVEVARLIEKLGSEKAEERRDAEERLRLVGEPGKHALQEALRHSDPEIALRAKRLLLWVPVASLIRRLEETIPSFKLPSGENGEPAWTPLFIEAGDFPPFSSACRPVTLDEMEFLSPRAVRACRSPDEKMRVCSIVESFRITTAAPELLPLLSEPFPAIRAEAITALGAIRAREAIPALLEILERGELADQIQAIRALGLIGDKSIIPKLLNRLDDFETRRGPEALRALATMKAAEAVPEIVRRIQGGGWAGSSDGEPLAELGIRETIPFQLAIVRNDKLPAGQDRFRADAAQTLGKLQAREAIPDLVKLMDAADDYPRIIAMAVLGQMGSREAIPRLLQELRNHWPCSQTAALALADIGASEVLPLTASWPTSNDEGLRYAAPIVLSKLQVRDAVPGILLMLSDTSQEIRGVAAEALARLSVKEAIPEIAKLLSSPTGGTRKMATLALGRLGGEDAQSLVRKMLRDIDPQVRDAALVAMMDFDRAPKVRKSESNK